MVNNVLSYALFENHLTSDPNDYMAVTTNAICLDSNALVELMLSRGSTLTETDILAVLKMEREVICEQAAMGNNKRYGNYRQPHTATTRCLIR